MLFHHNSSYIESTRGYIEIRAARQGGEQYMFIRPGKTFFEDKAMGSLAVSHRSGLVGKTRHGPMG
jgi:hypothetical protein